MNIKSEKDLKANHMTHTYSDHNLYCKETNRICKYCKEKLYWDKTDETDVENWHTEYGWRLVGATKEESNRLSDATAYDTLFWECPERQDPDNHEGTGVWDYGLHEPEEPLVTIARNRLQPKLDEAERP